MEGDTPNCPTCNVPATEEHVKETHNGEMPAMGGDAAPADAAPAEGGEAMPAEGEEAAPAEGGDEPAA